MKLHTGTKIVLALLGGFCGIVYYGYIDRAHTTLDKDGWHLEFSYLRWACKTCMGHIETIEYAGRPLGSPTKWRGNSKQAFVEFCTPVGRFKRFTNVNSWRFEHNEAPYADLAVAITNEELARGYYEIDPSLTTTRPFAFPRKVGTPSGWCLAFPANWNYMRWLDPTLIEKLSW